MHKKALGAVLSAGLARGHRGSPAAALRVHRLYCTPVLFSGLASLCPNKAEISIVDKHYQYTIQILQRLHQKTPRSIVFFLAGSLPGEALLHMRQLSLLSMICHLPADPLHQHARYILTVYSAGSWFHQIRDVCIQYKLPHPLSLLSDPVPKLRFKKLVKLKVTEYWQHRLATECNSPDMSSLQHFNPYKASLLHPHPMWTSSAGSCYETAKSTVLARMVSGRYRTEMMCRFWSTNRGGFCLSPTCQNQNVPGTLQHLLIVCPALEETRKRLYGLWCVKTQICPPLHNLILKILASPPGVQMRFILDCTAFPELIMLVQAYGQEIQNLVLYLTRTFAFSVHRQKQRLLGRWPEKAKLNPTNIPRPGTTAGNNLPATNNYSDNNYHDNSHLIAGNTTDVPSSPDREVLTTARQTGGAATRPEVAGVSPGDVRVCQTSAGLHSTTQSSVTSPTSVNMQQLCRYDRPLGSFNWDQTSQFVFSDDVQVPCLYQPDVVQTVRGPGEVGSSSEGVGTGTGSGSEIFISQDTHYVQKCKHGMQQCPLSCGVQLGVRAYGSGAVVCGSQQM